MEELRDIKPNLAVPDPNLWIYIAILVTVLLVATLLVRKFISKRAKSIEEIVKSKLKALNLEDSKSTSYAVSKYGDILAKSDEQKSKLKELNLALDIYKYQENPPKFNTQDIKAIEEFLKDVV